MSKKYRGWIQDDPVTCQLPTPAGAVRLETFVPWTLVKRGVRKEVITPLDEPEALVGEAIQERQARTSVEHTALARARSGAPLAAAAGRAVCGVCGPDR